MVQAGLHFGSHSLISAGSAVHPPTPASAGLAAMVASVQAAGVAVAELQAALVELAATV
jgi:hypothetical protein